MRITYRDGASSSSKTGKASPAILSGGCCFRGTLPIREHDKALDRESESRLPLEDMPFRFTYEQLSVATNGFNVDSKLGESTLTRVYKGTIARTLVAVTEVSVVGSRAGAEKWFASQVRVISQLRHRNLVKLVGWCSERRRWFMVHELMSMGNLAMHIHKNSSGEDVSSFLPWMHRLATVRGIAAAVAYLHEDSKQQVIHRNITSTAVMFDEDFNPKLGGFWAARLIDPSKNSVDVSGTRAYRAPECLHTGMNDKTDVFAFGVLLLEITSGKPLSWLPDWVQRCHGEGDILRAADRRLMIASREGELGHYGVSSKDEITKIQLIGLLCCHPYPEERPTMRDVEHFLAGRLPLPPVPQSWPLS